MMVMMCGGGSDKKLYEKDGTWATWLRLILKKQLTLDLQQEAKVIYFCFLVFLFHVISPRVVVSMIAPVIHL